MPIKVCEFFVCQFVFKFFFDVTTTWTRIHHDQLFSSMLSLADNFIRIFASLFLIGKFTGIFVRNSLCSLVITGSSSGGSVDCSFAGPGCKHSLIGALHHFISTTCDLHRDTTEI
jgi:hypothetical protein